MSDSDSSTIDVDAHPTFYRRVKRRRTIAAPLVLKAGPTGDYHSWSLVDSSDEEIPVQQHAEAATIWPDQGNANRSSNDDPDVSIVQAEVDDLSQSGELQSSTSSSSSVILVEDDSSVIDVDDVPSSCNTSPSESLSSEPLVPTPSALRSALEALDTRTSRNSGVPDLSSSESNLSTMSTVTSHGNIDITIPIVDLTSSDSDLSTTSTVTFHANNDITIPIADLSSSESNLSTTSTVIFHANNDITIPIADLSTSESNLSTMSTVTSHDNNDITIPIVDLTSSESNLSTMSSVISHDNIDITVPIADLASSESNFSTMSTIRFHGNIDITIPIADLSSSESNHSTMSTVTRAFIDSLRREMLIQSQGRIASDSNGPLNEDTGDATRQFELDNYSTPYSEPVEMGPSNSGSSVIVIEDDATLVDVNYVPTSGNTLSWEASPRDRLVQTSSALNVAVTEEDGMIEIPAADTFPTDDASIIAISDSSSEPETLFHYPTEFSRMGDFDSSPEDL